MPHGTGAAVTVTHAEPSIGHARILHWSGSSTYVDEEGAVSTPRAIGNWRGDRRSAMVMGVATTRGGHAPPDLAPSPPGEDAPLRTLRRGSGGGGGAHQP
ncbi:hypothetical protein HU200_023682 [Digitaria exilis]|uniref:Uncharacterized protein n=1 Tax=Digitaria exilis TaxID=1010633 RepID=A0A835C486_9POAL|nr:hypothetical protein HU200_023682 [Digitaria exilis]